MMYNSIAELRYSDLDNIGMMKQFRRFLQQDEGAVMVEMAVVMPFIFMLAYGIFEFGNVLYQHHLIATGVRDAARFLSRWPMPPCPCPPSIENPTTQDIIDEIKDVGGVVAKNIALKGLPVGGAYRVSWWNGVAPNDIDITIVPIANPIDPGTGERPYRGGDFIKIITVSTTVSYNGLGFLNLLDYGGGSITLLDFTLSHQERYNGR